MVTVEHLLSINFPSLSLEERMEIKNEGRPMPNLNIVQVKITKSREFKRSFNKEIYSKHDWLCGCSKTNSFFCFPCLLFCRTFGDKNWSRNGINDLAHLNDKIYTHEKSSSHINAHLNLILLGKQDIRQQQLSNAYRFNIQKHNETVANNRYILSKIINCIKFCGAFELAFRAHDENSDSENSEILGELINFSAELDTTLKLHIQQSKVFNGLSKIIQNEILECMLLVIRKNISNEIKQADFFSVVSNEITDVSTQFQISMIFRYILSDGTPVERFWGFFNTSGHDAKSLSECIKINIKEVTDNNDKLISQSYDGAAAAISGQLFGAQKLIRDEYKNAHFVHCYAHELNLILSKATTQNHDVRMFFSNLTDVTNFFSNSPQRVAVLNEIVNRRISQSSNTRWDFQSSIVNTVYENRELLIECMEEIGNTFDQTNVINQTCAIRRMLNDDTFIFWLNIFHYLMPHINILYNQLQKHSIDSIEVTNAIYRFEENIQKERQNFDHFQNEMPIEVIQCKKKRKLADDTLLSRIVAAKEVCDILIVSAKDRFEFKTHLNASQLFISANFSMYEKNFPQQYVDDTTETYPFLNKIKLKTELEIIYRRKDFRYIAGAVNLLQFIINNSLEQLFSETFKLIRIIVTIPMTSTESERSFSTLKKIKTFLKNTMEEDQLNALAMLSIEKKMVNQINNFNEEVIIEFMKKNERQIDLEFKNMAD